MPDNRTHSLPPHRAERRLVAAASDALKESRANPDHIDCPTSEAIEAIALRRPSYPNFDDVVDHIAMCAPCLEAYNRLRKLYRVRRRGRWVGGVAALLVLGVFWNFYLHTQHPKQRLAQTLQTTVSNATLDYTSWTAERSVTPPARTIEIPRVARANLNLTLKLPIGTEDGLYTVEFQGKSGDIVAQATGNAAWDGAAEILKVSVDLSQVPAGAYTIATQTTSASPRKYPVLLE